jgi:hypothetical protein
MNNKIHYDFINISTAFDLMNIINGYRIIHNNIKGTAANSRQYGSHLYQTVKSSLDNEGYYFREIGEYSITELKYQHYPVYSIIRNKNQDHNSKSLYLYKKVP